MLERAFDRAVRVIELTLAIAFIAAVALNFANVIGRYVLGASLAGADEAQIYVMVAMAFLGAVVVSWRKLHLRMDVLVQLFPAPWRAVLRVLELALLAVLGGFLLVLSSTYAGQMLALGRTSDTAGIPMWIPHGTVAAGFGLIALIAIWRIVEAVHGRHAVPLIDQAKAERARP